MRKSIKRILCSAMALTMTSSLLLEHNLRISAGADKSSGNAVSERDVLFTDVTREMDGTSVVTENFNSSVMEVGETTAAYEKRTVVVTLEGESLLAKAKGENVTDYIASWAGQREADKIRTAQNSFLSRLSHAGIDYDIEYRYNTVTNALALEMNTRYVSEIKEMTGVESVVIANTYLAPETATEYSATSAQLNETSVYKTGIYNTTGYEQYSNGMVVAVLDTGLDYTHEAFQTTPSKLGLTATQVNDKLTADQFAAETKSGKALTANDVYVSDKVPFAYDYADDDTDVYPSYSNHGTHVAGIIAGQADSYTNKDGEIETYEEGDILPAGAAIGDEVPFIGSAPHAQLVICKVFTDDLYDEDIGGAVAEDILAALEDCVRLGVDVINMSLGTSAGFATTDDGDDEGEMLNRVYNSIQTAGISLLCAASNDYSSGYGGNFGTNLASNPDSGTIGSPGTYASAMAVASISGQQSRYVLANKGTEHETAVFYDEASDENSNPLDFATGILGGATKKEFKYVVVPGVGLRSDYSTRVRNLLKDESTPYIALVKRGDNTFEEKVKIAMDMGAEAIIVYNNVAGKIRMNLGEVDDPIPAISIDMEAGEALKTAAKASDNGITGVIEVDSLNYLAGPFMSDFSSWGPTPDLKLKPEITAHGGEITSTVPGGYDEQSGTSMATPNMAGFTAIVRNYIQTEHAELVKTDGQIDPVKVTRLVNQLMMSTATTAYDEDHLAYSPRKQGAGLASLDSFIESSAYLSTGVEENDYRPKIELYDDPERTGEYTLEFKVTNFGAESLTFSTKSLVMTETISIDKLAVAEQAHLLDGAPVWKVGGQTVAENGTFTVAKGETKDIVVTLTLTEEDKKYIEERFVNGMYVEGFMKLVSVKADDCEDCTVDAQCAQCKQCDLTIPFLAFYGDWTDAPMLDYTVFDISESQQDNPSDENKQLKERVWATQAFTSYNQEKYILPMGSFMYLQDEDDTPMYTLEEYCSVSRYDEYYGEGNAENYLTSNRIQAVYAGLFRNARKVEYRLYDAATGEIIMEDTINRVGKAYAGGGQTVPANVSLKMYPDDYELVNNGQYTMEFDFYQDYGDVSAQVVSEGNTFKFSFYVDYDAPVLENVKITYQDYKEGNQDKQRIYLNLDVYDNHYAQSVMLCYVDKDDLGKENILKLATDYITPVRKPNKNGTTSVQIEITDIYELYKDSLYIQLDDYALNNVIYKLNLAEANRAPLPETFELAEGEDEIKLGVYETHKVGLVYDGNANLSNFEWNSTNPTVAKVKNGEIVGLKAGTAKIRVYNGKQSKMIDVTVVESTKTLSPYPSVSFGLVQKDILSLAKAEGTVTVSPGKDFKLDIITEPWYYDLEKMGITFEWSSLNPEVATVDQNGNVHTIKEGMASISAKIVKNGQATNYGTGVELDVQDEFTVSNFTLTDYNGDGGTVVIPTDKNIMYIGEKAFENNTNIKKIVIPETVVQIQEYAFRGCTALEEVYFVSENKNDIPTAKLSMIYQYAFAECPKLKKLDFSNTKTFTVAHYAFYDCESLETIVAMDNIGTTHDYAFMGCSSLGSIDLTGLHMSGRNVFSGCSSLKSVVTGPFTAIGENMFSDATAYVENASGVTVAVNLPACTSLESITLNTSKIGVGAFRNCTGLIGVTINDTDTGADIGANAFENCSKLTALTVNGKVRTIGDRAFANTNLSGKFTLPVGLQSLGGNFLSGSKVTEIELCDEVDISSITLTGIPFASLTVSVAADSEAYAVQNGVIYNKNMTKALLATKDAVGAIELPSTVEEIAAHAFAGSLINSIKLADATSKIGEGAFKNSALTSIDFGKSNVKNIEKSVFEGSRISSVSLPEAVKSVGDYAFKNTPLTAFANDSGSVDTLGNGVFSGCESLTTVALPSGIKSIGNGVFENCIALTSVTLPALTKIGAATFSGATALQTVVFDQNAETIGERTFMRTPVKSVTLPAGVSELPAYAFAYCEAIESVDLKDVTEIGEGAFYQATKLKTVTGLEDVTKIGANAFYGCNGLTALNLEAATEIGAMAFAIENGAAYTSVAIPNAVNIGNLAFYGGGMSAVEIDSKVKTIGYGAFSAASKLTSITVKNNAAFIVENGGLYRVIKKAESAAETDTYELIVYPAALKAAETDGEAVYKIKEGTVRIAAYAMRELNDGVIDHVVLPYSVKAIGDGAFYQSGILEYTSEAINAPVLETFYSYEIFKYIENSAISPTENAYRGFYYANFNELFINYTAYNAGEKPAVLTLNYPQNGKGYDSYVYETYFGTRSTSGVLMEDTPREAKALIESFESVATVESWLSLAKTDENKAMVENFSESVKRAHGLLNSVTNETQLAFIGQENIDRLSAVEAALRDVKAYFGISLTVTGLSLQEGSYKSVYAVGETFDMTGIVIVATYDDYSTEVVPAEELTLVTTRALTENDRRVYIEAYGEEVGAPVTVTATGEGQPDPAPDKGGSKKDEGCGSVASVGAICALVALGGVTMAFKKRED